MSRAKQKPKVRKQYNPGKKVQRLHQNLKSWTWQAQAAIEPPPYTRARTKFNGSWIPVPSNHQYVLYRKPMNWIIGMRALCLAPNGDVYIESIDLTMRDFRLKDLSDEVTNFTLAKLLLEDLKTDHIVDVGWMAHTFGNQPWHDDEQRVARWVCSGLGWLPVHSPWRKREWSDIHSDFKQVFLKLEAA